MNKSTQILSDITHFMKYAKYIPELNRRETYEETVKRNLQMHLEKFPDLSEMINKAYSYVFDRKVLPSMRSMQFAGKPIGINNTRIFNCAYLPVDHIDAFSEIMFLLLSGTGAGFSVQRHHIKALPELKFPKVNSKSGKYRRRRYVIGDSIEGWADAVKVLVEAYFLGKSKPKFVYSDIRKKGARLVTSGGKAPGPQPLKDCLHNIKKVLDTKRPGDKLTSLEVHDIVCYIADAVLAGGIRRAALISLFSFDDHEMATCKYGDWWESNPQRGRANNSAVTLRHRVTHSDFLDLWDKIEKSQSGEPGIYFSNNQDWGANPCVEIGLRPFQFCNLVEINASDVVDQKDLNERCWAGSFIATLQAAYTDYHYLREIWKETTEKDALIGVSMTGIASGAVLDLDLGVAADTVSRTNKEVASLIGINPAARTTCVKPAGTTSCILGTSSGIHAWHNDYFIRRVRVGKNEAIYEYLSTNHPDIVEDDFFKPETQAVISLPIRAPQNSILRSENTLDFLGRVHKFNTQWVARGHFEGQNSHNVSATVYVKENEWGVVGDWVWNNRNSFHGLSVLPFFGGTYTQAPFEDITKEKYEEMASILGEIDLTKVIENDDNTDLQGEIACGGGSCTLENL